MMKDLFDTITINERKRQRKKVRPREELMLDSDSLYDTSGSYTDRSFFDLDHAIAASGNVRSRGTSESLEEFDLLDAEMSEEY